jgi:hypothetical protein
MTQPLIYTTLGNVPIADLKYETSWDVQDAYIKFTETYRAADGEIVKQSAHVYDRKGVSAEGFAANLG